MSLLIADNGLLSTGVGCRASAAATAAVLNLKANTSRTISIVLPPLYGEIPRIGAAGNCFLRPLFLRVLLVVLETANSPCLLDHATQMLRPGHCAYA